MKTIISTLTLLFFVGSLSADAQDVRDHNISVFTGGFILKNSLLSTSKIGYEFDHWGLMADITYDGYREQWTDGSKSSFHLNAISLSGRYYWKPVGNGAYGELNLGYARPMLQTRENGGKETSRESLPLAGFGLGWRVGSKQNGLFGELGYRVTIFLDDAHLYTTDEQPSDSGDESISYQSWLFEQGKGSGQLFIGIGFKF